ncbi:MAG: glycerol-3-phosphate 1-O-acyltransferase PlsY [Alphaproteobacteria bacterium]|nr:glycerol-3-phosphate 1-O-acyltransferase PlsY [Alphaproteobacteria bacterium]
MIQNLASVVIGYLSGSVPYGLLLARAAGLGDVRKIGSGNIGATNVLRTGNKTVAGLTLLADVLKGYLPVLVAAWAFGSAAALAAGLAALAGHIFPVWLGFKGGKGVATTLGVLFGWSWPVALIAAATWVAMFAARRISSLSALTAAVVAIPVSWFLARDEFLAIALVAVVIFITHRANIGRLMRGEESRSSFSKKS